MATSRLEAADRVTLLMSFVPYLIDQGPVPVDQLAQHFDISPAQVQELVQLLAMSGVPGENGYYQHQDLFDINWDLFEECRFNLLHLIFSEVFEKRSCTFGWDID